MPPTHIEVITIDYNIHHVQIRVRFGVTLGYNGNMFPYSSIYFQFMVPGQPILNISWYYFWLKPTEDFVPLCVVSNDADLSIGYISRSSVFWAFQSAHLSQRSHM